jgi:hypothetical protein
MRFSIIARSWRSCWSQYHRTRAFVFGLNFPSRMLTKWFGKVPREKDRFRFFLLSPTALQQVQHFFVESFAAFGQFLFFISSNRFVGNVISLRWFSLSDPYLEFHEKYPKTCRHRFFHGKSISSFVKVSSSPACAIIASTASINRSRVQSHLKCHG